MPQSLPEPVRTEAFYQRAMFRSIATGISLLSVVWLIMTWSPEEGKLVPEVNVIEATSEPAKDVSQCRQFCEVKTTQDDVRRLAPGPLSANGSIPPSYAYNVENPVNQPVSKIIDVYQCKVITDRKLKNKITQVALGNGRRGSLRLVAFLYENMILFTREDAKEDPPVYRYLEHYDLRNPKLCVEESKKISMSTFTRMITMVSIPTLDIF